MHTHLFLPAIICQAPGPWLSAGHYVFPEPLFSQLFAEISCTCVIDNEGMSSRLVRGQASTRGTKHDARSSFLLFVSYSRTRAHSTAFSFV